jgi:hypothetical protein
MAGTDADPVALIGAQAAPAPAAAPAQPVAQVAAKVKPVQVKDDGLSILSDPGIGATVVE